ncbi:Ankyrin repeat-containing domain protein [Metarhizium robertsii ARSEF 23]|uniref:Ankyrin repeat-containing domain protein n=1 Tax=Metarhizium robertsii (strain ARSEF 23 / ATCC MYA-3075) TaxID=655844 RepID=A0A0B2X7M7_METRA|nr:Ankyrin repeat-containing domain protein [Metarhizium robertsii ARSEF 23]KHO10928.1 Ankyrin repeat-containing domain protein [Metarhizium robertsii ARSEF 23]
MKAFATTLFALINVIIGLATASPGANASFVGRADYTENPSYRMLQDMTDKQLLALRDLKDYVDRIYTDLELKEFVDRIYYAEQDLHAAVGVNDIRFSKPN